MKQAKIQNLDAEGFCGASGRSAVGGPALLNKEGKAPAVRLNKEASHKLLEIPSNGGVKKLASPMPPIEPKILKVNNRADHKAGSRFFPRRIKRGKDAPDAREANRMRAKQPQADCDVTVGDAQHAKAIPN